MNTKLTVLPNSVGVIVMVAKKRSKKSSKKTSKKVAPRRGLRSVAPRRGLRSVGKKSNHIPLEVLESRHARLGRIIKARHGHLAAA